MIHRVWIGLQDWTICRIVYITCSLPSQ